MHILRPLSDALNYSFNGEFQTPLATPTDYSAMAPLLSESYSDPLPILDSLWSVFDEASTRHADAIALTVTHQPGDHLAQLRSPSSPSSLTDAKCLRWNFRPPPCLAARGFRLPSARRPARGHDGDADCQRRRVCGFAVGGCDSAIDVRAAGCQVVGSRAGGAVGGVHGAGEACCAGRAWWGWWEDCRCCA